MIKNKKIEGYNDYIIYSDGRIYSNKTNKFLKPALDKDGYLRVILSNNNISKNLSVHRLVAKNFIDNADNKAQVNHINCKKDDNRIENLEWCTNKENQIHAWENGLKEKTKEIFANSQRRYVLDVNTGIYYNSILEASNFNNIGYSALKAMLTGQNKNKTSLIYA